jgi:hypothetical protein
VITLLRPISQPRPVLFVVKLCQIKAGSLHEQPRGLAGIQRTATADGDDAVALRPPELFRRFADIGFDGVGVNAGIQIPAAALAVGSQHLLERAKGVGLNESPVSDHQRALDAEPGELRRQFRQNAGSVAGQGGE